MSCLRYWCLLLAACGGGGGFPDAPLPPEALPGGKLAASWSLVRASDGSTLDCSRVDDSVSVTLLMRNRGFAGGFTEAFTCNTGMGTTLPVPVGTYDVNFELTAPTVGLVTTGAEQQGLIVTENQTTTLAPTLFTVDATGGLDLKIDALKAGGNCDTVANGGAGITTMSITLNHSSGGACENATIMIDSTPYTINCVSPMTTTCIEKNVPITATGLPSDNYQIHVRANQGANFCFRNDDSFRVPTNAKNAMRTLNLAGSGGAGCL